MAIEAPAECEPGDLLILVANAPDAKRFAWTLGNSDKTFLPVENGTKAVFASGKPGVYVFILAASNESNLAIAKHTVTIGEPEPEPPPTPPPPPPPPPVPNDKFGLGAWSATEAAKLPADARALSKAFGSNYRTIASAMAAGTVPGLREALVEVTKLNTQTAGALRSQWLPFFQELSRKFDAWIASGELKTPADTKEAFSGLANGLGVVQ